MISNEKTTKKRTVLQAVFDFLKQDDCDTYFGFETSSKDGSVKFLRKSASAEMWFCDVYASEIVEEILKFHAPTHLKHRSADFMNGVNVCYSNSDQTNYFDPIAEKLENEFDRYLKLQVNSLKFQVHRGIAIRGAASARDTAKIWSANTVDSLIQEKVKPRDVQEVLEKLTASFFESDVPTLFLEEYPEQTVACLKECCSRNPKLLLELLARVLLLELKPRPERIRSKLPKNAVPGSHSFKFLMQKVEQVAAADSYDELWTASRHIDYTVSEDLTLSKSEKKLLDRSVQEHSMAVGAEQNRSMSKVKDGIFLLVRAGISNRDVEQCKKHVNALLDQMAQEKGGESRG